MLARFAGIVAGVALFALPALGEPMSSKPHVSPNGIWTVRLVELSPGRCRVEVSRDSAVAWAIDRCVGTAEDHLFISNDGQRVWVLRSFPRVPAGRRYQGRPERWGGVEVAAEYERGGQKLAGHTLAHFMPRQHDKVRDLGARLGWLAGVGGLPGKGPRETDAGVVEFETAADKTFRLKF